MTQLSLSAREILEKKPVEAGAPCRIDSGGTWDIKTMALPLEGIEPVTVNMALSLRTKVALSSYEDGLVRISSEGFSHAEEFPLEKAPFDSVFGLFFACVTYFGFHGMRISIKSDSPIKSALGGSSTALVALIKALSRLSGLLGKKEMTGHEILHLGYHLEDGTSGGNCGIQDQAAAVFGGVNLWTWKYGNNRSLYKRESLLDSAGIKELSRHIVVAFSGQSHVSARINRGWLRDFLSGKTRSGWIETNNIVRKLAHAIKEKDWNRAAGLLQNEMAIRSDITPDALIPITEKLIDQAEECGCGARFTGAGAGGSLWAVGGAKEINHLKKIWQETLSPVKSAGILDCRVDSRGVR
jgi:D-glycero-alpha-D-manno-heptose-7-phosphate kinase